MPDHAGTGRSCRQPPLGPSKGAQGLTPAMTAMTAAVEEPEPCQSSGPSKADPQPLPCSSNSTIQTETDVTLPTSTTSEPADEDELEALEAEVVHYMQLAMEHKERSETLSTELLTATQDRDRLEQELAQLNIQTYDFQQELDQLNIQNFHLQQDLQSSAALSRHNQDLIRDLQASSHSDGHDENVKQLHDRILELESLLSTANTELAASRQAEENTQVALQALRNVHKKTTSTCVQLERDLDKVKSQLANVQSTSETLSQLVKRQVEELEQVKATNTSLTEEMSIVRASLSESQTALTSAEEQHGSAFASLMEAVTEDKLTLALQFDAQVAQKDEGLRKHYDLFTEPVTDMGKLVSKLKAASNEKPTLKLRLPTQAAETDEEMRTQLGVLEQTDMEKQQSLELAKLKAASAEKSKLASPLQAQVSEKAEVIQKQQVILERLTRAIVIFVDVSSSVSLSGLSDGVKRIYKHLISHLKESDCHTYAMTVELGGERANSGLGEVGIAPRFSETRTVARFRDPWAIHEAALEKTRACGSESDGEFIRTGEQFATQMSNEQLMARDIRVVLIGDGESFGSDFSEQEILSNKFASMSSPIPIHSIVVRTRSASGGIQSMDSWYTRDYAAATGGKNIFWNQDDPLPDFSKLLLLKRS